VRDRAAVYDVPDFHLDLYKDHETGKAREAAKAGEKKAAGFKDGFMPELYHRMYTSNPVKVEKPAPGAALRGKIHDILSELPEYETLRKQTVRDPLWSGIATAALGESVATSLPEQTKTPDADRAAKMLDSLRGLEEDGIPLPPDAIPKAEGRKRGEEFATAEQAASLNETELRNALRNGIAKASDNINDAETALTALGYGNGTGANARRDPAVAIHLANRVRNSEKLKSIIALAGRITATARAKRATRSVYARNELVGVEPTRHLSRILPSEMSSLASPIGTANLYRKLLENAAMGYSMEGKTKLAKGPIIICLDQSGSMAGDRDVWGKAVALALLDAARSEKRPFGLILYDSVVRQSLQCPDPDKVNPIDLLEVLSTFSGGGTSFLHPLVMAMDWIEIGGKLGKADIVHITDGAAGTFNADVTMARAEKLGATIYGIGIDLTHGGGGSSLQCFSHSVTCISDVNRDTAAVDTIFDNIG
jgi:hypothetical protein